MCVYIYIYIYIYIYNIIYRIEQRIFIYFSFFCQEETSLQYITALISCIHLYLFPDSYFMKLALIQILV